MIDLGGILVVCGFFCFACVRVFGYFGLVLELGIAIVGWLFCVLLYGCVMVAIRVCLFAGF